MNEFVAIFQVIATVAGAAAIFIHLGRRDQQLNSLAKSVDELRVAVADLVKTTVAVTTSIQHSQRAYEAIERRLERVEHERRHRTAGRCDRTDEVLRTEVPGAGAGVEL